MTPTISTKKQHSLFSYTRGMHKFELPIPDSHGQLPDVNVVKVKASVDTTNAHDPSAMDAALARRDLNVVPSFLPCKE